jgi:hypothetical protein
VQIGVINRSRTVSDADVAFWVKACSDQAIECATERGINPIPVAFYSSPDGLPSGDVRIISIVDSLDEPGVLGYHDDEFGVIYGMVLAQGDRTSVTLSHEILEMLCDPKCNRWITLPDGIRMVAEEVCDPVEADTYPVSVTIFGETRQVSISNYVLPSWFDPRGEFPFDKMRRLGSGMPTMRPGGYLIVRDDSGNVSNVFASKGIVPQTFSRKLSNALSRTLRRTSRADLVERLVVELREARGMIMNVSQGSADVFAVQDFFRRETVLSELPDGPPKVGEPGGPAEHRTWP